MRKNYMVATALKNKLLSVDDISTITGFGANVCVGGEISPSYKLKDLGVTCDSKILKLYNVWNRIFLYALNGVLYEYVDGNLYTVAKISEKPLLTGVVVKGNREVLVQTDENSFIVGTTAQPSGNIPIGSYSATYKGKMFVADNTKIYFGGPFSFDGYSVNLDNFGFIGMPMETGGIKGLAVYGDALIIITAHAIYKLTVADNVDYVVERIVAPALSVAENSCKVVGDAVYFISGKRLAKYKNGNVTFLRTTLLGNNFKVGESAVLDDKYLVTITYLDHAVQAIYSYDTISGLDQVTSTFSTALCDGGIVADDNDNRLYVMDESGIVNHGGAYWDSKVFDFNSAYSKVVSEINIVIDKPAELLVRGDFGLTRFTLEKGRNVKRLNLLSKTFEFDIKVKNDTFSARDLKIKYRVVGDNYGV